MATRTAYPGTEIVGDVLTKANFDKLPGGLIGRVTNSSDQNTITTEVDVTGLSVAPTVGTSRKIRLQARLHVSYSTAGFGIFTLKEGSTALRTFVTLVASGGGIGHEFTATLDAPSAGVHTYKLTASVSAGNINIEGTDTDKRAELEVEDLGPSF